jgi:hypothetical protein
VIFQRRYPTFVMGMQVFLLATGISVVRHGAMPKWLAIATSA